MRSPTDGRPLLRTGRAAWAIVGIIVVAFITWTALAAVSGLVIPLVIAAVLGVLLHPAVDRLKRLGLPRSLGAVTVLLALGAILFAAIWFTVVGVVAQGSEIAAKLTSGLELVDEHLTGFDLTSVDLAGLDVGEGATDMLTGLAGFFGSAFSSAASFLAGTLVAVFFLYFLLSDWDSFEQWVARHVAVGDTPGDVVVKEASVTLRRYFGALTSTSAITAVLIGLGALVLDVPLVGAIALVTFVTSYIPYLGAIFSGAFAVLIALGSQGPTAALILLIVILVAQNLVQTLMLTKLTSDKLRLHPIVTLGSTIVGAALAGVLGATLSAPVTVIILDVVRHHREALAARRVPAEATGTPEATTTGGTATDIADG
ncbi:AI-2E family transporter [Paraoerskovia marina]|uniref:AI-2E family transporter n=1 Tax=Paraoerskovia marina TaxID=545619 RepID=UPI000492B7C6|nr:AI-2E family transporter [Paraoerskovia marina]